MKKLIVMLLAVMLLGGGESYAQFKGLGNKIVNKGKEKVEQKVNDKKNKKQNEAAVDEVVIDAPAEENAETEVAVPNAPAIANTSNALDNHYAMLEQALERLETAIEAGDMAYLFEAPEGNEAKKLINESANIKGFDANSPRYIELRDRYADDVRKYKMPLCSDQPATKVNLNDKSASKQDRLNALYTQLEYYESKANDAQYYREKEYYLSIAALCWKTICDAKLMQLNDAKLKELGRRLNALGRQLDYNDADNKAKSAKMGSGKLLMADQVDMVGPLPHMWFQIVDYTDNDYSNDANVDMGLQKQTVRVDNTPEPTSDNDGSGSGGNDVTQDKKFFVIKSDGTFKNGLSKWGKINGNDIYVYESKGAVIIPTTRFASGILEIKDLRSGLIVNVLRPYGSGGWEVYDNNNTTKLGYVDSNGNVYKRGSLYCKMDRGVKPIWGAVVYLTKIFE